MIEVRQSPPFAQWLRGLRDANAAARILQRIRRMERGNPGDVKPVGGPVMEMRVDYGPGYRVYYMQRGAALVVLLCGGDKRRQQADIQRALDMADNWKD
ncbi:type II toxin-antitoxin system RelE/ParE family toxin [Kumtagia ephedrae]|uniref:Addiction module antitoxin RelB n=1 Tax=Kumtagia ephedrae TaxID=2116701 RepID=A0A2P7S227_9HYPH|nr:type II toxin-antitoxin system RelE/ParE family toxin [Mesorhizobium ephedrae]PSJ56503.1 addiction module antitoxin RelB [Mesorhizobium ephedrae]